jgi:hypothetical protein
MAVTLKRKRGAVSYKEPSSDDDMSGSSDQGQSTRTKRNPAPTRRSTRHPHPATVDEESSESEHDLSEPESAPAKRSRASRTSRSRGKRRISYKDASSDEEDEEDPDGDFEIQEERVMALRTRSRPTASRSPRPQKVRNAKGKSRRKGRHAIGAPLKPNKEVQPERKVAVIPTDGHNPVCVFCERQGGLEYFVQVCELHMVLRSASWAPDYSVLILMIYCLELGRSAIPRPPPDLRLRLTSPPR